MKKLHYLAIFMVGLLVVGCKNVNLTKEFKSLIKTDGNSPISAISGKNAPKEHEPTPENCIAAKAWLPEYREEHLGIAYKEAESPLTRKLITKCNIEHLKEAIKNSENQITLKKPPLTVNEKNCAKGTNREETFLKTEGEFLAGKHEYLLWFSDTNHFSIVSNKFKLKNNLSENAKINMSRYCEVLRGNKYLEYSQQYLEKGDFTNPIYMIWAE